MSDNEMSRDGDSPDALSRVPPTDVDPETLEKLKQQVSFENLQILWDSKNRISTHFQSFFQAESARPKNTKLHHFMGFQFSAKRGKKMAEIGEKSS